MGRAFSPFEWVGHETWGVDPGWYGYGPVALTAPHLSRERNPLPPLPEQRRIVTELDAEAAQMEAVRALLPRFEAKIQRVFDGVWGKGA